jgi:predicted 2-oxoglutarate/Fe(II)-dependent dioxygenase YbiX
VLPPTEIGSLSVFPSYQLHEVTPVESGIRRALVGWVIGPKFK